MTLLIRDGLNSDIESCLQLDHRYETEHVWQVNLAEEVGQWQVVFKTERLPRKLEVTYPGDEKRLTLALPAEHCFLVAIYRQPPSENVPAEPVEYTGDDNVAGHEDSVDTSEDQQVLGYLTMRHDPVHRIALIQDIVVSRPYRRAKIGSRLLKNARQWAREHQLAQLMVETQTKNYPAISFCQQAGFTFCGFNDHYFRNQDIAVFFSQSLR
jgi:ribosomal protein S18 acetylase RimI-like enzyme